MEIVPHKDDNHHVDVETELYIGCPGRQKTLGTLQQAWWMKKITKACIVIKVQEKFCQNIQNKLSIDSLNYFVVSYDSYLKVQGQLKKSEYSFWI